MAEFLDLILSFPTVIFTALLGLAVPYWLLVILGALDLEVVDSLLGVHGADGIDGALHGGMDGAVDGAVHGVADAALHGAADAALHGAADAALHGAADAAVHGAAESIGDAADAAHGGIIATLLPGRGVPITIALSAVTLLSWMLSYTGMYFGRRLITGQTGESVLAVAVLIGAVVTSLVVSGFALRPLSRAFQTPQAARHASFVGKVCTLTTGRVDATFGQAEIDDGGTGFLAQVRCPRANSLKRGDQAIVYQYDAEHGVFQVAPLDRSGSESPSAGD